MKYCRECGAILNDDAAFCDGCGVQQGAVRQSEPAPDFAVVETVKDIARSPLFLVVCALFTVADLLQLVMSGVGVVDVFSISGVVMLIVPTVITVCFWSVYISAKKGVINVKSLNTIKIIFVVTMIVLIAYMVLAFAAAVIINVLFYDSIIDFINDHKNVATEVPSVAGWALIAMIFSALIAFASRLIMVVTAVAIPVSIVYFLSMNKTLKSICSAASKGVVTTKISIVSAVVSILIGALIMFGGISIIDFMKPTYLIFRQILMFGVYGSLFIILGAFLFYCRRKLVLLSK